jgi:hypothetical protein
MHEFPAKGTGFSTESPAGLDQAAEARQAAVNRRRNELLDATQPMLGKMTVAPGTMAGGIIKLDPAQISQGQLLKLVVTVGGEPHEFIFEVGT